jgi:3-phosphoshikimate 1-carboxyvinyltransferase
MKRIIGPLQQMGAKISSANGRPPVRVTKAESALKSISYQSPVPSAQVKSSLLFAGLFAEGTTVVTEDVRTRDHGELALRAFGAKVDRTKDAVSITGRQKLTAIQAYVPGDISSAAFFLCLAALFPDSNLVLDAVGMNPTRSAILDVLSGFGARVSLVNLEEQHGELIGTLRAQRGQLRGGVISGTMSARLIDELPLLAAIAPFTTEGIEIRDAQELRIKESDRISCTAENLRRMGAEVVEFEDGLRVPGNQQLHGAELDSFGDHRIGMAFAVAATRANGETLIRDAEAVAVSFPEFWDFLDRVVQH